MGRATGGARRKGSDSDETPDTGETPSDAVGSRPGPSFLMGCHARAQAFWWAATPRPKLSDGLPRPGCIWRSFWGTPPRHCIFRPPSSGHPTIHGRGGSRMTWVEQPTMWLAQTVLASTPPNRRTCRWTQVKSTTESQTRTDAQVHNSPRASASAKASDCLKDAAHQPRPHRKTV